MGDKVLVVGGTGLVGNALVRAWARRGAAVSAATYHCHPSDSFRQLDMQDEAAVRRLVAGLRPSIVAVPAANPFVDYCELHPEETRRVNVAGTMNVARACAEVGARMIFFSSDYVFDGAKGMYREDDAVSPLSEYGRQKADAEAAVLKLSSRNLVVRTAGAYGWQWEPKNFVLQVLSRLSAKQAMKVASEIRYSPTYVENLAEVTVDLAAAGQSGVFHVVGADFLLRGEFARLVAGAFGLSESLIVPVSGADYDPPAKRPKQARLLTDKVLRAVATPLWGAAQGLAHMVSFQAEWRGYARAELPQAAAKP